MPVRDDPDKTDQLYSCFKISCCSLTPQEGMVWHRRSSSCATWKKGWCPTSSISYLSSHNQTVIWMTTMANACCVERLQVSAMAKWFGWPSQLTANNPGFPPPLISSSTMPELLIFLIQWHLFCFSSADGHIFRWQVPQPKPSMITGLGLPHSLAYTSLLAVKSLLQAD